MKTMKRVVSFVLCFAMVFGLLPMNVLAAEDTDYLFFATDRHTNTSIIGTMIDNMEKNIGENELEYLGLGGDMVGSGNSHPAYNSSTVLSEVTGATSSLSAANVDIVAGIHDMNVTDDAGIVLEYESGGAQIYEGDKYYVYGVPESCISGAVSGVDPETEANDFVTWANGSDIDKSKVIIVLSHYPLHQRRNDNDGANYWAEALNTVAVGDDTTIDRDIVFFWGHNHTGESSADTAVYHVAPGNSISVQGGSSSQTIYFTYANAGYLNAKSSATLMSITDTTITFDKYVNSSVSTTNTVTRVVQEETKTLTSIAVSGDTEYTVGDALALTVTATYSDGTTADVTADAAFEPAELTASGTYTVTASYGGMADTIDVTVTLYDEVLAADGESLLMGVEAFSQGATALEVTWDDAAAAVLDEKDLYTDYVVYDLAVTNPDETTEYAMSLVANMDTANLAVYHVADDGTLTLVSHTIENDCVVFTTGLTGTFAYGSITVPEGYTLSSITLENIPTDLFVGSSLDLTDAVITATYTKEGEEDYTRQLTVYDYDETNFSGYDVNDAGAQTAVFTFDGVTAELPIHVWGKEFTSNDVTVKVGESEYGVTGANVAESTNVNVATAISGVIEGDNYVAYDITLTYSEGYAANEAAKTVTLPIPEGVENPVVYYVSDSGKSVVDMKATITEDGEYVTFTTTHFSTYVLGDGTTIETESGDAVVEGTGTSETTVYVLVDSLTAGNEYLIVNTNAAGSGYAMDSDTSGATVTINAATDTITNPYIDNIGNALVWTASSDWGFASGNYNLGVTVEGDYFGRTFTLNTSTDSEWSYSSNSLSYSYGYFYTRYLACSSTGTWSVQEDSSNVYFYEKQTVTTGTVGHTYSVEGTDINTVAIKDQTVTLSSVLYDTPEGGTATDITASSGLTPTYEVVTTKGNSAVIASITDGVATLSGVAGTAVVKVTYTSGDLVAWDEFIVTANAPNHYTIQLHMNNDGVLGEEITEPVALKGIKAGDTYSVWAVVKAYASADDTTGTDIGTLGDALTWSVSDTSIANIDPDTGVITFTGTNFGTFTVTVAYEGADGVVITDTITISATDTEYIVPGDGTDDFPEYPNEGAVRFDKTATAVGNFSETGIAMVELSMTGVPYSTGNELDVVLMLDMTGSMDDVSSSTSEPTGYVRIDATIAASKAFISTIVKNEDGSYNDNRVGVYVFNKNGAATLYDFGTVDSDTELEAIYADLVTIKDDHFASGGTPYDDGLAKCKDVLAAAKTDGTGNDRQQFCVFMTDGVPTSYAYVNGTTYGTHSSADSVAGMLTSASDYATRDTDYKYEYYSTEMKKAGVTVYSVGVGLFNENNAWSGSATQCGNLASALLNDISGPANEESQPDAVGTATLSKKDSYFFSVDDADAGTEMTKVFENIAQKILEAATDVVVEDKIGNNYSVNFSVPGYGTSNAVSEDALDGTTEFYIQVVDYTLDSTTHERTDTYTVLENFTFNADGTLKSHTVGGVACSDCAHVTTTDGVITAIDGTYFDYKSDSTGEYLTWTAEKLTSTELVLQYFAYLKDSSGVSKEDQIAAGTYYTNEYATITYDNVNGNRVQQEFPVPQMTWYGAQVSYVFYLVNEAGQPVNKAGRVVPFAEAVYVTDVNTFAITWNDLEQSAGLDAERLAEALVPDVYALYDDDASYNIHVYADEEGINLNNHFVIGGDVTDDYNTTTNSWTNANTTYVFNTKADATKYNTVGAYIANDDNTTDTSYYCKSAYIANATYTTSVDDAGVTVYTVTSVGDGYKQVDGETQVLASTLKSTTGGTVIDGYVYYVDDNGVYTIVQKTDGTEVRPGFDFANTTVAFAVVWKPQLAEDTVVIDYGLDVIIDVIENDGMAAGVVGVRADAPSDVIMNSGTYDAAKATSADLYIDANSDDAGLKELKVATATVENLNAVRVSLDKTNGMQYNKPIEFYYEADVNYYVGDELKTTSMYSKVTVIPATTIYYEDDFVDLASYTVTYAENGTATSTLDEPSKWTTDGTTINGTQDQDRPGASQISEALDADNNYGYDSAYETMSTHSMGSAATITVNENIRGEATFTFYGTGFDVISMTSNTTGTLIVQVFSGASATGTAVKTSVIETYYGYAYVEGEWVTVDTNNPNALYQVPVMKIFGLDYGQYTVKIIAGYNEYFNHTSNDGSYDLYLDAIRIYDPTGNTNDTANDAYIKDGEGWPSYTELRDKIITKATFDSLNSETVSGIVFIDGATTDPDETVSVADYTNYGPNNELYLASGEAVAFDLNATATNGSVAKVQLGIKTVGGTGTVEVYSVDSNGKVVKTAVNQDIETATDMYYDITELNGKTVVIKNSGTGAIVSLTNIKVTYTEAQTATESGTETQSNNNEVSTASVVNTYSVAAASADEETVTDSAEATTYLLSVSRASVSAAIASMSAEEETEDDSSESGNEGSEGSGSGNSGIIISPTEPENPGDSGSEDSGEDEGGNDENVDEGSGNDNGGSEEPVTPGEDEESGEGEEDGQPEEDKPVEENPDDGDSEEEPEEEGDAEIIESEEEESWLERLIRKIKEFFDGLLDAINGKKEG